MSCYRFVEEKIINKWIIDKNKKKFTYLINGDYGIGKSFLINNCLDSDNIKIFKLDFNSLYDTKGIKKEYDKIIEKIETYSNIEHYSDNHELKTMHFVLLIDQNEYFSIIENKQIIKNLVTINHKNEKTKLLIFIVCKDESGIYQKINVYSEILNLKPFNIEIKKKIFNIQDESLNYILNSSNDLNIIENKLRMKRIKLLKNYELNNNIICDEYKTKKQYDIKDKILELLKIENLTDLNKYLYDNNIDLKNLDLYIQENLYSSIILSYETIEDMQKKKSIINYFKKINKVNILINKYKLLLSINQNWNLLKYLKIANLFLNFYYLKKIHLTNSLYVSDFSVVQLNNKLLVNKKYKENHNFLSFYYTNNIKYHYLLINYIIMKYLETNKSEKRKSNYIKLLKHYKIDKEKLKYFNFYFTDQKIINRLFIFII